MAESKDSIPENRTSQARVRRSRKLRLAGRRTRAAPSQLPAFLQRATDLADRHLDADCGAVVARLPADRLGIAAWARWVSPARFPCFCSLRSAGSLPTGPTANACVIATQIASMMLAFILAALTLTHTITGVAHFRAGRAAGRGERVRHPRPAVVSGRHGRQRRSDERHRAEFVDVQRRARDRSGGRGRSGGEAGRGLVLLRQRRELHRGDHRIDADERARSGARARQTFAMGRT